jgi:hypothetical protein
MSVGWFRLVDGQPLETDVKILKTTKPSVWLMWS